MFAGFALSAFLYSVVTIAPWENPKITGAGSLVVSLWRSITPALIDWLSVGSEKKPGENGRPLAGYCTTIGGLPDVPTP